MPLAPKFSCWRYEGSCKERSACAPPGAGKQWGARAEPRAGWKLLLGAGGCGTGRTSTEAAAKGSEARLLGLVHGICSSAGLRLRPRPWIPFPRKNAVKVFFVCLFGFLFVWGFCLFGVFVFYWLLEVWGWEPHGGYKGNAQRGRKLLAGHSCQGTLNCSISSQRLPNLSF